MFYIIKKCSKLPTAHHNHGPPLDLTASFLPPRFGDDRGWFCETYNARSMAAKGLDVTFVQDNHSLSRQAGTVRGVHFQKPPFAQGKLVRVLRGRILDIAVDVRRGSPTYGHYISAELSAENNRQLYVPVGYAHGFVTLEADSEVAYKVTAFYDKNSEGGFIWNDPAVGIDWQLSGNPPLLSAKDEILPGFAELDSPFDYDGTPMQLKQV